MNSINIRCLLSLITFSCLYLTCSGELDFQFNDELQVTLPQSTSQQQHHHHDDDNPQPVATLKTQHHHKSTYSKEISQCPYTEDKIMLSLILKSNDWSNIIDNKKNRAINKLSKFFNIPKEYLKLDSISRPDMIEMAKWSIKRGPNKCNSNRHHGKIEFMIGCGQSSYFIIGNSILKQIGQQMKDGGIDDITGVDFGWWVIWRKRITNRVSRKVRDIEGSGIEEEDYVYDDEDDEPMELTEIPTTPIHAHRHHHGINKPEFTDSKIEKIAINTNIIDTNTNTNNNNNIKYKKNDFKPLQNIDDIDDNLIINTTTLSTTPTTTTKSIFSSSSLSSTTTILDVDIVKSDVSQLESVITKTIENNEKIKDLGTIEPSTTLLLKSKKKSNKRNKIDINSRSSTIYNINIDKSKEDDFIRNGNGENFYNNGNNNGITESITYRIPSSIGKLSTTPINLISTIENAILATTPSTTTATTDIYSNTNRNFNQNNNLTSKTSLLLSSSSLQSSSSSSSQSSLLFTTITYPTTTITTTTDSSFNINQKLINLEQSTLTSTVNIAAKNNDESSVVPPLLTDDIVTNNIKTTTPSITATATTTPATSSNTEINPFTSTVEYEPSTTTTTITIPTTTTSSFTTSTISSATTTLASVKTGDEDDSNTNETLKEDEILNETTTNRLEDTTVSAVQQSVLIETSTNAPITTTTPVPTTTTTTPLPSTEYIEPEPINTPPIIKNRLPKQPVTAGKLFSLFVPAETFYDNEDATNLRLELFDKNGHELKSNSWLQFNPETREIYGLPLEDAVSRYNYRLTATDSGNETITETLDISVQQHKGHRSVNHEISLGVKLNQKFLRNIDWQIRLVKGISDTLKDDSSSSIVVREVRQNQQDPYFATFIYTNESLPKDKCPDEKLDELLARLDREKLTESVMPELSIKSITGQPIGPCQKFNVIKTKPTPRMTKNSPPLPRNQVDRVNATVGHLLVYKVPPDTFYDDEDTTDLKLTLLTNDRTELGPRHWLQFDTKNQEFYGIPRAGDYGSEEYILVAEDREGLTASDALIVVVNHSSKREYNVYFKVFLGIRHELFNSHMQRKFVERIAKLFNDPSPQYIQIRSITTNHDADGTIVNFFNTTLHRYHRNRCPEEEIEMVRNIWFSQDTILRDRVKKTIGSEFDITNVQMMPLASCYSMNGDIHRDIIPFKTDDNNTSSTFKDDYMLTFVLPAIIILAMILLALIIACVLHRRRLTGKMELGDEEERKSFRSKGIPVIFQDELDEKPEIGNKSPIILKDEKPPLLPPSYNSTNIDGDNDCDEYVPPPAVVIGGREIRGKSPVTPSYRKPPPYVSP